MAEEAKSKKSIIIIIVIIIVLGGAVGGYFALKGEKDIKISNSNINTAANLKQYDKEMLIITSDQHDISGLGIVVYQEDKDNLLVYFHVFVNDSLILNGTCGSSAGSTGCEDMIRYEYGFKLLKANQLEYGAFLSPIVCNKGKYPDDITKTAWDFYGPKGCDVDDQIGATTEAFLARGSFETDSYDGILGNYGIKLVDSSSHWKTEEVDDGHGKTTTQYTLDSKKAVELESENVASYSIKIKSGYSSSYSDN